ncbi:MAG TPA: hypothetical protein VFN61_16405 [Acidimicrobiales bacterium]|nr:hypothetical protein [Acidimicrobiales bacterium]
MPDPANEGPPLRGASGATAVSPGSGGATTDWASEATVAAPADWVSNATEKVIAGVDKLKSRTTRPAVKAMRAIVYGIAVLVALVAAVIFAVIGVVRIWDAYLPISPLGRRVWTGYIVIGGLLFLSGAALLSRRQAKSHGS